MSEQEKMDDQLRSKFSEMDFPFDEENWAKAEEMIVAARKKEKRRRWGIIFFFGILIGVLVMIPFLLTNSNAEKSNTLLADQKKTTTQSKTENTTDSNIATTETKPEEKKKSADETTKTENVTETAKTEVRVEKQFSNEKTEKSAIEEKKINPELIAATKEPNNIKNKPDDKKGKNQTKTETASQENTSTTTVHNSKTEKLIQIKTDNKKQGPIIAVTEVKDSKKNSSVKSSEFKKPETFENSGAKKEELPVAKNADEINTNAGTTSTVVPNVSVDTSKHQTVVTNPMPKGIAASVTTNTKKDSLPVAATQPTQKSDSLPKKISAWTISLDGGINAFLSGGSGVSPIVGINITRSIGKKLEAGTGIYYTYIPTYSSVSSFTTDAAYDFGSTFKITEIATTKLHYVAAPLFVKYNLNEKNAVVFGATFYYLFNSSNIITTYDVSYFGIQNKVTAKATGYYNGFSPYDVGIMAGYRKNLFENFGVALYVNYGLQDLQKANNNAGTNIHTNISGQLMLTYRLFK